MKEPDTHDEPESVEEDDPKSPERRAGKDRRVRDTGPPDGVERRKGDRRRRNDS